MRIGVVLIPLVSIALSGCGMVPGHLEDAPGPGSIADEMLLVQAINQSIKCEITNAVLAVIKADKDNALSRGVPRQVAWLEQWGVQVGISLAVDEKTALNPSTSDLISTGLSVGGSLTSTWDVVATDKENWFVSVADLEKAGVCTTGLQPTSGSHSPLIQADLGVRQWLSDQILPSATGLVSYPTAVANVFKQNVLSREVKFDALLTGGVSPTIKLLPGITIGQSGTLVMGTRDKTSDLVVTFGPVDPTQKNSLTPTANDLHVETIAGFELWRNGSTN